jgi:flagellar hook assembly protein FlgD
MNIQGVHPAIMAPVMAQSATGSNSTGSSSATSASDLQSTFLNLLVTELQNQDPTSPVDPTQMVSQMVSLNQLNELVSINQTLSTMASGSQSNTAASGNAARAAVAKSSIQVPGTQSAQPLNVVSAQPSSSVAMPTGTPGLMNLYGSYGVPTPNSTQILTGAR